MDIAYSSKLKQLLWIIAESAPFKPNISKLSEHIGINRTTLLSYLHYLQDAGIIKNLYKQGKGISRLQKPDKIYLENPNVMYTFKMTTADIGNVRETFFMNQIAGRHTIRYPKTNDFLIDESYLFEIGGKNKNTPPNISSVQLPVYFALDQIEYGHQNRIPLWLFGFLY